MQDSRQDASLGSLFADLTRQMGTLVRKEVQLASTEMTQKASQASKDVASIAIGGAIAYAGLLGILAAIVIGLATLGLPWWLSALIVGVVVAAIGYVLIQRGREGLKQHNLAPNQTIDTLKEDAAWAKEQAK